MSSDSHMNRDLRRNMTSVAEWRMLFGDQNKRERVMQFDLGSGVEMPRRQWPSEAK